jgi:Zn-dependent membrane protease YugP
VIVPLASLGSQVYWILIVAGAFLGMIRLVGLGIILFSALLVLQLLNLPVELDSSRRAREILLSSALVNVEEDRIVARALNAAAWTYVAATLTGAFRLFFVTHGR